ncbi:hypothetical protein P3T73_07580 [Kiritimatiellota bacterium B12222]|nr:hypothetical protein P3T73_07580 [Kiritimatiellota bacterium B12222]
MISKFGRTAVLSFLLLGTFALKSQLSAQPSAQLTPSEMIQIRSVEAEKIASPRYAVDVRGQSTKNDGSLQWLEVSVEFDTRLKWTDEITFTMYVVLQGKPENLPEGAQPVNMFSGTVTIVNVPQVKKGNLSMYLDPYTLARYGEPTHVAVVATIDGEPAAGIAEPSSSAASQWWTRQTPNATPLLSRDKTPYIFVEIDGQNTIQP